MVKEKGYKTKGQPKSDEMALDISFGNLGYYLALARQFPKVSFAEMFTHF